MFKKKQHAEGRPVTVLGKVFACHVCQGMTFYRREVQLNTAGMTLLDLDWLNRSADGVTCTTCGYVHLFYGDMHTWMK